MRYAATSFAGLVLFLVGTGFADAGSDKTGREETVTLKWHTGVFGTSLGYADRQPYFGAVRFTPSFGCTLSLVRWFQSGDAATAHVFVWGPGTEDEPGALVGESVPSSTGEDQWHEVAIPNNQRFPADHDFWVGVRIADYNVGGGRYPFGADAGPQVPPKRSLYASRDGDSWYHISPPPPQYDRNWLLEAVVRVESLTGMNGGELPGVAPHLELGPNPLTGGFATLRFSVGAASLPRLVTVGVYDATGRLVRHWSLAPTDWSLALDLRCLSAGVYLIHLDAEGFSQNRKLVVQTE